MGYISIKDNKQDYYGLVRKSDLLLRAEFPDLETTIYQTDKDDFVIYIKNKKVDFETVEHEFEKSIRPIFVPLKLSLKKPKDHTKIITNLEDKDIPKGLQGVLMQKFRWADMLMSKFPDINFYKISDEPGILHIHIANYWIKEKTSKKYQFLTRFQEGKLVDFLRKYQSGLEFRIHIDELIEPPPHKRALLHLFAILHRQNQLPETSKFRLGAKDKCQQQDFDDRVNAHQLPLHSMRENPDVCIPSILFLASDKYSASIHCRRQANTRQFLWFCFPIFLHRHHLFP